MSRRMFVRVEWAISVALVFVTVAWSWWRGVSLRDALAFSPTALLAGVATGALLWTSIPVLRRSPGMRPVWEHLLVPFSRSLSRADVVMVALLSGISEELFFRGVLMRELGLVPSSLIFGVLHALTWTYAGWATVTGSLFGLLAVHCETLVAPIVAHATYNLGALFFLQRSPADGAATDGPAAGRAPVRTR